jgi:hypothetical protein
MGFLVERPGGVRAVFGVQRMSPQLASRGWIQAECVVLKVSDDLGSPFGVKQDTGAVAGGTVARSPTQPPRLCIQGNDGAAFAAEREEHGVFLNQWSGRVPEARGLDVQGGWQVDSPEVTAVQRIEAPHDAVTIGGVDSALGAGGRSIGAGPVPVRLPGPISTTAPKLGACVQVQANDELAGQ